MKSYFAMYSLLLLAAACAQDYDYANYDYEDDRSESLKNSEQGCTCVPFYLCSSDGGLNRYGGSVIEPRNKDYNYDTNTATCGPYHVCCSASSEKGGSKTPAPDRTPRLPPYVHRCGIRNVDGVTGRILSPNRMTETSFGEWPWQTAILKEETPEIYNFICGGSLIDNLHVLTVAHCVNQYTSGVHKSLIVRLAEWDAQSTREVFSHENFLVTQIFVHPKYKPDTLLNDIAILRLNTSVNFKPYIDTICLPDVNTIYDGQRCVVTGWGKDAYENGRYSSVLRQVSVPVIEHNTCQAQLRETRLSSLFQLYDGFICAGGEKDVDSCKGDGGGPLACPHADGRYRLVGLVSWGIDCGKENVPGVYVRVQKYLRWITRTTGKPINFYWPGGPE